MKMFFWWVFVACLLPYELPVSGLFMDTKSLIPVEQVYIQQVWPMFELAQERKLDRSNFFPQRLHFQFRFLNSSVHFNFQKSSKDFVNFPVFVIDEVSGIPLKVNIKIENQYYRAGHHASVSVVCQTLKEKGCMYELSGMFINKGHIYGIFPGSMDTGKQNNGLRFGVVHTVYRLKKIAFGDDVINIKNGSRKNNSGWRFPNKKFKIHWPHGWNKRSANSYRVELLLAVDHTIFNIFYEKMKHHLKDKKNHTYFAIKEYYGFFVYSMDLIFQRIRTFDFIIGVMCTGLLVAETKEADKWTKDAIGDKLPLRKGFVRFQTEILKITNQMPTFDHGILITRFDIGISGNYQVLGFAAFGSICEEDSFSVVEENFQLVSIITAAHELGHSLGAPHDGDRDDCSHNYLMSSNMRMEPRNLQKNFVFSQCSINHMKLHFKQLGSENCLNMPSETGKGVLDRYMKMKPGQLIDVNEQCKMNLKKISGPYSCPNDAAEYRKTVCLRLLCRASMTRCIQIAPLEGTSCGTKHWCEHGKCVWDPFAPKVPSDCWLGDKSSGLLSKHYTCRQMADNKPFYCYRGYIRRICCMTCSILQKVDHGCEYGDHKLGCQLLNCDVYDEKQINDCCETCYVLRHKLISHISSISSNPFLLFMMQTSTNKALCFLLVFLIACIF